jgi:hypothetical protein
MNLKQERAELIQQLRKAKTAEEEDIIKEQIDGVEERMAVDNTP